MGKRSEKRKQKPTVETFSPKGKKIKREEDLDTSQTEHAEPPSDAVAADPSVAAQDNAEGNDAEIAEMRSIVSAWLADQSANAHALETELQAERLMGLDDPDEPEQEQEQVDYDMLEMKISHALSKYTEMEKQKSFKYECEWGKCKLLTTHERKYFAHVESHAEQLLDKKEPAGFEYKCEWDLCDFETTDRDVLYGHVHYHAYHTKLKVHGASMHMLMRLPNCSIDSRVRNTIVNFPVSFRCEWGDCDDRFNRALDFFYHVRNHVVDLYEGRKRSAGKSVCRWALCKQAFADRAIMFRHVWLHTGERHIACFNCGGAFYTRKKYLEHCARQVDVSQRKYQCGECGRYYTTMGLLKTHLETHDKTFQCTMCPRRFGSPSMLAKHVGQWHLKQRNFHCPKCEYASFEKRSMLNHIQTVHEKKLYRCEEFGCNVAYHSESAIKRHIRWHYNLPPITYACHLCDARYKTHSHRISKHLRFVHQLERSPGMRGFRYRLDHDGVHRLATYVSSRPEGQCQGEPDTNKPKPIVAYPPLTMQKQEAEKQRLEMEQSDEETPSVQRVKGKPKIKSIKSIGAQEIAIELDMDLTEPVATTNEEKKNKKKTTTKDAKPNESTSMKKLPMKRSRDDGSTSEHSDDSSPGSGSPATQTDAPKAKSVQDFKVMKRYLKLSKPKTTKEA